MANTRETKPVKTAKANNILAARIDERAALLAASDDAAALVPRMPPEELLFTLRAATREDALAVLEHARPSQVRFLLDMEIWKGEEVDAERAGRWLTMLDDCGQKPLGRWLTALEVPDLAALTGRIARASLANEAGMVEKDDAEGENSLTLDGLHYITAEAELVPRIQRLLMLLRLADRQKHDQLVEILFTGFDSEDEEVADRFRRARLSEHGFTDMTEARRIYATMEPTALIHQPPRVIEEEAPPSATLPPVYPVAFNGISAPGALVRALDRLARTEHNPALFHQLARLTNLVVSADAMDPGLTESFARAARKVAGRLTIALELVHPGDARAWDKTLSTRYIEHLFRVGNTRVMKVQAAARRLIREGWPKGHRSALSLLGDGLAEAIRALAAPLPMIATEAAEGIALRDFAELADVQNAERTVIRAALAGRFAKEALGIDPSDEKLLSREADFAEIFLTALANSAIGRDLAYAPLAPADAKEALAKLLVESGATRKISPEAVAAALARGAATMKADKEEIQILAEFFSQALARLEDEFGRLPVGQAPDPRYFAGLWLEG